jgi:GNAT superfamily N-acetyltransferase
MATSMQNEYAPMMAHHWSLDLPRFGDAKQLSKWLQLQLAKCDDESFGLLFAKSCSVPGLQPEEYRHRILKLCGETLLVGIRFKGGDVAQPFVDLLAWTGEPKPTWIPAIGEAFSNFDPLAVRFGWSRNTEPPWPGEVDQYLYAGVAQGTQHEWVQPAHDLSWFQDFRSSFERWQDTSPLGREVQPAEADDLEACLGNGSVVVATCDGTFLGLAACRWKSERAFAGWAIVEEYVVPEARGQGLGAALQSALMHCLPLGDLVWGTIHGKNVASQVTAARCGREMVETWWFTPLKKV